MHSIGHSGYTYAYAGHSRCADTTNVTLPSVRANSWPCQQSGGFRELLIAIQGIIFADLLLDHSKSEIYEKQQRKTNHDGRN